MSWPHYSKKPHNYFKLHRLLGHCPREKWPDAVSALGAKKVYARPEGPYIVTSTFFVEEKGLFLPQSAVFRAQADTDPQYKLIVEGLYTYQIKA